MAEISAPKAPDYDARRANLKRRSDIQALRAKPVLSQTDQTTLLTLLMDDYLARNP